MKNNLLLFITFCLGIAQTTFAQHNIDATYRIRLGAYSKTFDKETSFKNVEDLGALGFENADNGFTRAYLGSYLGKSTAQKILSTVKKRGYKEAYIVRDNYEFTNLDGSDQTHTLQISAIEKLNVSSMVTTLEQPETGTGIDKTLYIWYDKGVYRLCLGLFAPNMPATIDAYRNIAARLGITSTLERTFRKGTSPVSAPKAYPTDPAKPTADAKIAKNQVIPQVLSKQDSIELINKIAGNKTTVKPINPIKDTIKASVKAIDSKITTTVPSKITTTVPSKVTATVPSKITTTIPNKTTTTPSDNKPTEAVTPTSTVPKATGK